MAWQKLDTVPVGKYIQITKFDVVYVSLPGSADETEILARVQAGASGWTATHVVWDKGFLGFGSTLRIFGQAATAIPAAAVADQAAAALNSFWGFTSVTLEVYTSDSLADPSPKGSEWSGTIQLIAVAVIAVAVVYGIKQLREISE